MFRKMSVAVVKSIQKQDIFCFKIILKGVLENEISFVWDSTKWKGQKGDVCLCFQKFVY